MREYSSWPCRGSKDYERPKPPPLAPDQRLERLEQQVLELTSRVDEVFDAFEERIAELEAIARAKK